MYCFVKWRHWICVRTLYESVTCIVWVLHVLYTCIECMNVSARAVRRRYCVVRWMFTGIVYMYWKFTFLKHMYCIEVLLIILYCTQVLCKMYACVVMSVQHGGIDYRIWMLVLHECMMAFNEWFCIHASSEYNIQHCEHALTSCAMRLNYMHWMYACMCSCVCISSLCCVECIIAWFICWMLACIVYMY